MLTCSYVHFPNAHMHKCPLSAFWKSLTFSEYDNQFRSCATTFTLRIDSSPAPERGCHDSFLEPSFSDPPWYLVSGRHHYYYEGSLCLECWLWLVQKGRRSEVSGVRIKEGRESTKMGDAVRSKGLVTREATRASKIGDAVRSKGLAARKGRQGKHQKRRRSEV